jgi:hypothetical protein
VYDMYPWDRPASASRSSNPASAAPAPSSAAPAPSSAAPARSSAAPAPEPNEGARAAVQVALDRRDNGGDGAGAVAAAHRPTTGPTRQ